MIWISGGGSVAIIPGSRVVVSVWVSSMGQIDLFKNYLYLIGPYAKKILLGNNYSKNVNMNVQWIQFLNLDCWHAIKTNLSIVYKIRSMLYAKVCYTTWNIAAILLYISKL